MAISYRKKPVEIEAVRWTGENASEILDFIGDARETNFDPELSIKTLEGWHCASVGDYIIKGVQGEFYPCKPDVFEMSYVSMENGAVYISVIGDPDGGLAEGSVEGSEIDVITACLAILQALFCRSGDKKIIKDVITDMLPFVFDEDVKPRRRTKTAILFFVLAVCNLLLGIHHVLHGVAWLGMSDLFIAGAAFVFGIYELILTK